VIVETVGVGQSEIAVAGMTDLFVLLQLPNSGDDLQALKKGVLELADIVLVNKTELDSAAAARAEAQIAGALHLLRRESGEPSPAVMRISAATGAGVDTFLDHVLATQAARRANGELAARRERQRLQWMWDIIQATIVSDFRNHPVVRKAMPQMLLALRQGDVRPSVAARRLLDLFEQDRHAPV
jgi:LAO/AO transport system kinase